MKFIKDFLNSGTAKQQKRKRLGALLISITAALLVVALLVLAGVGIVKAIKNRGVEEEVVEDPANKIPNGYVTTTFTSEQMVNGTLLKLGPSQANNYKGVTPTVRPSDTNRTKTADGQHIYKGEHEQINLIQETFTALDTMMVAFHNANVGSSNYTMGAIWLPSLTKNLHPEMSDTTKEILKSGYAVIFEDQYAESPSIYDAEAKTGKGVYQWIYDNAAKYGFIQVADTEAEGNVFRYVGVPHATYMTTKKLTFDEYLTKLDSTQAGKTISVSVTGIDGKVTKYEMYYVAPTTPHLVPEKGHYTVSGDNAGGYIVTVNKTAQNEKKS